MRNANIICAASNLGGLVLLLISFLVPRSLVAFVALFALGELMIFMIQVRGLACVACYVLYVAVAMSFSAACAHPLAVCSLQQRTQWLPRQTWNNLNR